MLSAAITRQWPDRRLIPSRGIPCGQGARGAWPPSTSQGSTLAAAAATGRLEVRTGAVVRHIERDPRSGRATGVIYVDRSDRREQRASAKLIFLCASTIESTRILLCSELANSSGVLGHYLMDHPSIGVRGEALSLGPAVEPLGGANAVLIPRFRNLGARLETFARGYLVWGGVQRRHPSFPESPPRFALYASCEMLPARSNRVTLDGERIDAWGIPAARIECRYSSNEAALLEDARRALREMLASAGLRIEHEDDVSVPGAWVHELGGARMGRDPRSSVLNAFNQAWDVPNLFVTDGASFPSGGCQNPTLTIAALTVRACAFAVNALKRGAL